MCTLVPNGIVRIPTAPRYHHVHGAVNTHMSLNSNAAIRDRLQRWMADEKREGDYAWLAAHVKESRGSVRKWVSGRTGRVPASFIGALEAEGLVSARYLLTGALPVKPVSEHDLAVRLDVIGRIVSGELDAEALQRLATSGAGALRATRDVQAVVPPADPEDEQHTPPAASRTRPG